MDEPFFMWLKICLQYITLCNLQRLLYDIYLIVNLFKIYMPQIGTKAIHTTCRKKPIGKVESVAIFVLYCATGRDNIEKRITILRCLSESKYILKPDYASISLTSRNMSLSPISLNLNIFLFDYAVTTYMCILNLNLVKKT